jgi:hypothetical protein
MPLGAGFGHVFVTDKPFVDPQFSVADKGAGWPQWQVFIGFNMQFKS